GHGAWNLRLHIAIVTNAVVAAVASRWLLAIAAFATEWQWLEILGTAIIFGAALAALYLHLRIATHLTQRTAVIVATAVPLALGGSFGWWQQQSDSREVNRVELGIPIFPPQIRVVSAASVDDYVRSLDALKRAANRKRQQSLAENPLAPNGD
ncbi:MAG TPA: hypothetical protein VET48_02790, partial [Steroidobacteraceae bacterium]|nr:hypothetical protein [Steroidobacteraceae bacterium]